MKASYPEGIFSALAHCQQYIDEHSYRLMMEHEVTEIYRLLSGKPIRRKEMGSVRTGGFLPG